MGNLGFIMDVRCKNCGEPWDTLHLLEDEVHETEAGHQMSDDLFDLEDWQCAGEHYQKSFPFKPKYTGEPWTGKLTDFWRKQFAKNAWDFGETVLEVIHCNCCDDNVRITQFDMSDVLNQDDIDF